MIPLLTIYSDEHLWWSHKYWNQYKNMLDKLNWMLKVTLICVPINQWLYLTTLQCLRSSIDLNNYLMFIDLSRVSRTIAFDSSWSFDHLLSNDQTRYKLERIMSWRKMIFWNKIRVYFILHQKFSVLILLSLFETLENVQNCWSFRILERECEIRW